MKAPRRISSLGVQSFAIRFVIYALGLGGSVAIARALGPEGRGAYFIPVTTALIAYEIASLGLPQAQFRLWSHKEATTEELISAGCVSAITFGTLGAGLTALIFAANPGDVFNGVTWTSMIITLAILPVLIHNSLLTEFLTIKGHLSLVNGTRLLGAAVQTLGLLLLYAFGNLTISGVIVLWAATFLIPWVTRLPVLYSLRKRSRSFSPRILARQISLGLQFLPSALFLYLNLRLDVFFVSRYSGLNSLGVYSIAVIFAELVWLATDSLTIALMERQANAPDPEAADITGRAVGINLALTVLVGIIVASAAQFGIPLVYGDRFSGAAATVWLLLPAGVGMAVWRTAAPMVTRLVNPWVQPLIALTSLFFNVVANVILIPRLGIAGAALASSLSYGVGAMLSLLVFLRAASLPWSKLIPRKDDLERLTELLHPRAIRAGMLHGFDSDSRSLN